MRPKRFPDGRSLLSIEGLWILLCTKEKGITEFVWRNEMT
jgi:hypothetical protein